MTASDQQHSDRPGTPADPPRVPSGNAAAAAGTVDPHLLQRLADAHGVGTSFQGWDGLPHSVAEATLIKVLAALGVKADTNQAIEAALAEAELAPWRRVLPPAVVIQQGEPALVPVHVPEGAAVSLTIALEDEGGTLEGVQQDVQVQSVDVDGVATGRATFALPEGLPLGWHTMTAEAGSVKASAVLVVTPRRLTTAAPLEQRRGWGLATQLYSVRSRRSWGIGDFSDLADLAALSGARGADYVLVNPLHAAEPVPPVQPSPYSPSTRRFFNPLYIRVEAIPELAYLKPRKRAAVEKLHEEVSSLNREGGRLDRNAVYAAKLQALEMLYHARRSPARQAAFDEFCRISGRGLDDFALWSAIREDVAPGDPLWKDPSSALGTAKAEALREKLADRIGFHRWLQWICDEQLEEAQKAALRAGMRLGVVHDLAVGVDHSSADAWTLRDVLAPATSVGAPPDMYNQQGQDWGQPPWHPARLAEAGYQPFRNMLATVLRHAGGIRVDHILGLFRLWWIPVGNAPGDGAYVRYDHEALIGILALEAQRAGAVVIGEDLGTFEPWVRDYLAARGILGTSILWFEYDGDSPLAPEKYRTQALASVNTHDLPPTAGYLAGDHVALRSGLGLLERSEEEERAEHNAALEKMLALVRERGYLPGKAAGGPGETEEQTIEALHLLLTQTPSVLLGVALVDAVGERRVQNQPGTSEALYPNWQVPLGGPDGKPVFLDDLPANTRFNSLLKAVEEALHG
ncbi:4-alpha-glucanotransferase [Pseudarthrobacter phenanthrenivorans]|uniref:4-alpha-glucanotransferase n=1 Tax=Pseudarthrobacter phenanthrenivorans TaxID=361575 RepID=A0A3B0FRP4_PSEPS|nr:4-alpha-glucanotransferase [Pseudarthrobacter phenanthrenivorans]RKO21127.1 4-alpha-glucanotransferase [Pseudarthrobacter phenanthrenivorans]TPV48813.1 4-alpha-glucanotransferase [Pseudarthrobacter phenanthrenivorans]